MLPDDIRLQIGVRHFQRRTSNVAELITDLLAIPVIGVG